jgi:hypothetical protein
MQDFCDLKRENVATVVFELQNIYNNNNNNNNDNNNNNVFKRLVKYSGEYFKYGWHETTRHPTAFCPRLTISPTRTSVSYYHQLNCAKWYGCWLFAVANNQEIQLTQKTEERDKIPIATRWLAFCSMWLACETRMATKAMFQTKRADIRQEG